MNIPFRFPFCDGGATRRIEVMDLCFSASFGAEIDVALQSCMEVLVNLVNSTAKALTCHEGAASWWRSAGGNKGGAGGVLVALLTIVCRLSTMFRSTWLVFYPLAVVQTIHFKFSARLARCFCEIMICARSRCSIPGAFYISKASFRMFNTCNSPEIWTS